MTGFLRSLFGSKKSTSKIKPRMQTRRLELLGLEERITPVAQTLVDFTTSTGVLSLTSDAANFSVVANTNGTLTVNSTSDVSAGSSTTVTVTRIGSTNDYTVSVNSGPGNVKELSLVGDSNNNVITISSIDSSAFNADFGLNVNTSTGTDTLAINGPVALKGTGALTTAGIETLNISATGDITTMAGAVNLVSGTINSAGDVSTGSGNISYTGNFNSNGNVAINSVSGNLSLVFVNLGSNNLTIDTGSGNVGIRYVGATTGNLSITTTNTTTSAISILGFSGVGISSQGSVDLKAGGNISVIGDVNAASVNAKSTAGYISFANRVITTHVGGFTSETSDATKATKIADTIDVGAGANALIKGNLITTTSGSKLQTTGSGNITITGNVDASATGNDLTLEAGSGVITISGNIGSGSIDFGDLIASGTGTFLASGTIKANKVNLDQTDNFATSITFAKAVTTTGSTIVDGVYVGTLGTAPITFLDTITTLGDPATSFAQIRLFSDGGAINVAGAITGLDFVEVTSNTGDITLSGSVTTSGTNGSTSGYVGGDISIVSSTSGNILLSGNISAMGTGQITINNRGNVSLTINGNVSTVGGGEIFIGTNGAGNPSTGTGNLTINGTVTINAGIIYIGAAGPRTVSINKALTTTAANGDVRIIATGAQTNAINFAKDATITSAGMVIFKIDNPTNTISFASGANISAVGGITDGGAGGGNLNLANNLTTTNGDINIPFNFINLTGSVSMKAAGSGKNIFIGNINGAQNLTLEATGAIILNKAGQTTALKTVTVTNSDGFGTISTFNAANMVLTDSTNTIAFSGATVITSGLTTAAKAYSVSFAGTTVLSGAPVFLNTGGVSFGSSGNGNITSLTNGATIIGNATSRTNLGGIIVSGGAFNIGTAGDTGIISIANGTQLILNSTSAGSTFANPVAVTAGSQTFNLLGVGSLTLSGDSSANMGDNFNITNGTLNVTGKIASTVTSTNGTITGAGGTIGDLTVNTGTVAPGGTLNTGVVTFNAATNYNAAILTTTTASNLKTSSVINLNGANLALSSIPTGLAEGDVFTIIDNTAVSTTPINGTFAGLPEGATISALDTLGNTVTFAISYVGGSGNDVTLRVTNVSIANPSAIPQPMVAGQPLLNFFTAVGADAGGGPMVTVTIDILPGLTTVPTYFSFFAYDAGFTGGVRVAVNELDGDANTTEIITGAGPGGGPNVKVFQFNFATLTFNPNPIASFFAFNDPNFQGGVYVAGGDVTGDGIGDLLVGAGAGGGPRVQVYAGSFNGLKTSAPVSDFFAYSTAFTGGVVVAAGDRTGDNTFEVITGPASNGGYNIKSFNVASAGNNPTLVENFFAFNDFTSIGGVSIATAPFDANPMDDLVIGTTNTQFGVILNQNYAGIKANPFPGFTGAIRAGFADNVQTGYQALAAAGPGGGPVVTTFSVGATSLTQTDTLFVLDPAFTGGLFAAN